MKYSLLLSGVCGCVLLLGACSDRSGGTPATDAGNDSATSDMSVSVDMPAPLDMSVPDLGPADLGPADLGPVDEGTPDLSVPDTGPDPIDAGPAEDLGTTEEDCTVTGCPDGYTCEICWSGYACLPLGAIC